MGLDEPLSFSAKVYDLIVDYAYNFQIGARGLRSICEKLFLDALYALPNKNNKPQELMVDEQYAKEKLKSIQFNQLKQAG